MLGGHRLQRQLTGLGIGCNPAGLNVDMQVHRLCRGRDPAVPVDQFLAIVERPRPDLHHPERTAHHVAEVQFAQVPDTEIGGHRGEPVAVAIVRAKAERAEPVIAPLIEQHAVIGHVEMPVEVDPFRPDLHLLAKVTVVDDLPGHEGLRVLGHGSSGLRFGRTLGGADGGVNRLCPARKGKVSGGSASGPWARRRRPRAVVRSSPAEGAPARPPRRPRAPRTPGPVRRRCRPVPGRTPLPCRAPPPGRRGRAGQGCLRRIAPAPRRRAGRGQ